MDTPTQRNSKQMSAIDTIGIRVEHRMAAFDCLACEILMSWDGAKREWVCCECDNGMTIEEAAFVVERGLKTIKQLAKMTRKVTGGRWHWLPW